MTDHNAPGIAADISHGKISAANTVCEPIIISCPSVITGPAGNVPEGMGSGIPIKSAVVNGFLRNEKCVIHRRNLL